uniref:COP-gamma_platf domain-containing protein n=1 Tax=Steinernema glaseri TaxID=37863 RepID=A0A1I7ZYG1_9BILA
SQNSEVPLGVAAPQDGALAVLRCAFYAHIANDDGGLLILSLEPVTLEAIPERTKWHQTAVSLPEPPKKLNEAKECSPRFNPPSEDRTFDLLEGM